MVNPCELNLPSTNGPVPTGVGSLNVAGLLSEAQTCCGTIWVCRISGRLAYSGALKFSVAVLPDAVALVGTGVAGTLRAGNFLIRLKVKATSAALNGLPSLHFTPDRVVMARVLPPLDQV